MPRQNDPAGLSRAERFLLNAKPYAGDPVPMHGSVEFRLMYQFHASIPEARRRRGNMCHVGIF